MAQLIADRRDVDFCSARATEGRGTRPARALCRVQPQGGGPHHLRGPQPRIKEILPTRQDGDRQGARFDGGKVFVPESFHKAWKATRKVNGWP